MAAQGLLVQVAHRFQDSGAFPPRGTYYCGAALALFVPVAGAALVAVYGVVRHAARGSVVTRHVTGAALTTWRTRILVPLLVGLALGLAARGYYSFSEACFFTFSPTAPALNGR
jgi:hypothetical protein